MRSPLLTEASPPSEDGKPTADARCVAVAVAVAVSSSRGKRANVYLIYREIFTIHAICSWCVSIAVVFTLLVIVGTLRVLRVGVEAKVAAASA